MKTSDFEYTLPPELIAQAPLVKRDEARMLVVSGMALKDKHIRDIGAFLNPNDILVTNNTKVVRARFFGRKPTGAKAEFLLERPLKNNHWLMQIGTNKKVRLEEVFLIGAATFTVKAIQPPFFEVAISGVADIDAFIEQEGELPLPPYIERTPDSSDERRYQTVFAKETGAVAAPTAGLHFSEGLLDDLENQGIKRVEVTLHVGAGTFRPVKTDYISDHEMHYERMVITQEVVDKIEEAKAKGGRIIAVGTTSVRALESAALSGRLKSFDGDTNLFITPGFQFKVVDKLLTNFHLPKSTLLMMVSAFAGYDEIMNAYRHSVESRYRFFSYGDAMLLERK